MQKRFGGFTEIDVLQGKALVDQGKDREEFADFYKYANERGTLFYTPGAQIAKKRPVQACTGPVSYVGQAELKKEIDVTVAMAGTENVFLTSTAPAASKSIGPIATTRTTRNMSLRSPRRCASNMRRSPRRD
jgi:5-methyltetrahydropteroyltriglutamate--homocysteine methyltransferase